MVIPKGYRATDLGLLPEGWDIVKIGDITTAKAGGTPSTLIPHYWGGSIPWMSSGELHQKRIRNVVGRITVDGLNNSSTHMIPHKCVLVGLAGQGKTRGTAAINYIELCTNQSIAAIYPSDNHVSEYLYQNIDSRYSELRELSTGDGGRGGLNLKIILNIPFPYPPLPEQAAIAEALSDADSLIASIEKLIAKKKAIKQGAMQELLTGKKRLPGFSGEWFETSLGELCYLVTKQTGFDYTATIKPSLSIKKRQGYIPFIQNKDFQGYVINNDTDFFIPLIVAQAFPKILLNEPCLLISISGRIGNVGYYDKSELAFIGGAVCIARFKNMNHAKWVMIYLQSSKGQVQIFANEKSGAQHNLTIADIRNLIIPMPNENEQTAITSFLSDMDIEIEQLEKKLAKYHLIKQGMMQELLTGRIRLIETDKKAESAPKGHNQHYDDAIAISAIVNAFYDDRFILGRVKVQKLLYLLRRKQDADVSAFKKKAAGPYNEEARYKGGESIAVKSGYIAVERSDKGSKFSKGGSIAAALKYVDNMQSDIDWLVEKFRFYNTNKETKNLEVLATVDMAACELEKDGKAVNLDAVKDVIRSNKEWAPKLQKTYFTDPAINQAILESKELFS